MSSAAPTSSGARSIPPRRIKTWRWTVEKYDRATRMGWFGDRRLELIAGRIIEMPPQLEPHAAGICLAVPLLTAAFGTGHYVRVQMPIHLGKHSKPEPDLAVVVGGPREYVKRGAPTSALLIVEVSDTTLEYDRGKKASLYAQFNLADYWVINLLDRQVEIHRGPAVNPSHPLHYRYGDIRIYKSGDSISPLAVPAAKISVSDLLP